MFTWYDCIIIYGFIEVDLTQVQVVHIANYEFTLRNINGYGFDLSSSMSEHTLQAVE